MLKAFIIAVVFLACTSCSGGSQRLEVTNVEKPQVIKLQKRPTQKFIHGMSIKGRAKLNGKAQVRLMLNGKPYRMASIDGKGGFDWGGDWYADSMEVQYQPENATSGRLVIEYSFLD